MSTGQRIKNLRTKKGLTQVELAFSINVSKQTMYKYENDIITNIPSDKIEMLADVLYTTPAYLMEWENDPHDWERIGNEEGIYPPGDYEGNYEDFVKSKMYEQSDALCDSYWNLLEGAIDYLKSINCKVSESDKPCFTNITTPDKQFFEVPDNVLVNNYMIFGTSKPGIRRLITPIQNIELRDDEKQLLNYYNQLNNNGRIEAQKRMQELVMLPSYTKAENKKDWSASHLELNAAHERTDAEITDEMRQHDDDIMNDEDF